MIPKGNQRGGGQQLAAHLMNSFDNDRVEVAHLRGSVAQDLSGAFAEWHAQSKATKAKKYLYSLSLNPDQRQRPLTRDEYMDFVARAEKRLGLENQPRALVFHVKHGREHAHVVWSRIDTTKMKAVQLSHDRQTLRTVVQEFAKDHGITLPPSMQKKRGKERFKDRQKVENLTEKQQQERTGVTKKQHSEAVTVIWRETDNGKSFVDGLEAAGYYLARGDRKTPNYVVVDRFGEVHPLARRIDGIRTKDLRARLIDYPLDRLPGSGEAKAFAKARSEQLLEKAAPAKESDPRQAPEARRAALVRQQTVRRDELQKKRVQLESRHAVEKSALAELQRAENAGVLAERTAKQPKGVVGFLARITGIQAVVTGRQRKADKERLLDHRRQNQALARRQDRERRDFTRHERALARVEKRETKSLETTLRRERLKPLAAPVPTKALTPEQRAKAARARKLADDFRASAAGSGKPPRELTPEQRAKIDAIKRSRQGGVATAFNQASVNQAPARPAPAAAGERGAPSWQDTLTAAFNRSAAPERSEDERKIGNGHAGSTDGGLTEAFRKAQEQKKQQTEQEQAKKARDLNRDRGR